MRPITVIMTVFNKELTVEASIQSVLAQDYPDFELLIVDDGSQDGSEKVISKFLSDPRIRYFRIENRGAAGALNFGLQQARGYYVALIDSDDEYYPNHLSSLWDTARKRDLDFAFGNFELIHCGGEAAVVDYYNPQRKISLSEIKCISGIIFGKRQKILEIGAFQGDFYDIRLFDEVTRGAYRWQRCLKKTYRYYFGRLPKNLSEILRSQYSAKLG